VPFPEIDAAGTDPDTTTLPEEATDLLRVIDPAEAALDRAAAGLMAQIEGEAIPPEMLLLAEQLGQAMTDHAATDAEAQDET
jgi:hypothetical protein